MTLNQSQPRAELASAPGQQGASRVINPTFSMEGENLRSAGFDIESLLNDEWSIGGAAVTDDACRPMPHATNKITNTLEEP